MKHLHGPTWSLFLAACLAMSGCSSDKSKGDDIEVVSLEQTRLTRVMSKAHEGPYEEAEELERDDFGGSGTAMALDEGKYAMRQSARRTVIDSARNAGIVAALNNTNVSSLQGTGTLGYGAVANNIGRMGPGVNRHATRLLDDEQIANFDPDIVNTESHKDYGRNPMVWTNTDRLSTFAVDVDTASYTFARGKIRDGAIPHPSAVRVEEFVNYFHYGYGAPDGDRPFDVHMDAAPSPFTKGRHVLRVGVQAKKLSVHERKAANLVFLVDVSGSMSSPNKLGLAKRALRILVHNLRDGDNVALITYAGRTEVVLEPTGLKHKSRIMSAIENLQSGGSTNMGSGIQLAYERAARNLGPGSLSRVIVLSDGDANVGKTSHKDILDTIRGHVKEGVTLSTIGFGMGNYKDDLMEQLANKGNGNYYYIDGISQARRVFQEQLGATLEVVAKDVKIQVEFDPAAVARYRLIGYENRAVADRDFRNDRVDAGEIGAGHSVTAMYEVELTRNVHLPPAVVHIRAKKPRGERAKEWAYGFPMSAMSATFEHASSDFRFATAVMGAAEILRHSEHASTWKMHRVVDIASAATENRAERREFVDLMSGFQPKTAMAH